MSDTLTADVHRPRHPGPPQNVTGTVVGLTARFTWQAPAPNGSRPLTGYEISYTSVNGVRNGSRQPANATVFTTPAVQPGLVTFTIVALNQDGGSGVVSA